MPVLEQSKYRRVESVANELPIVRPNRFQSVATLPRMGLARWRSSVRVGFPFGDAPPLCGRLTQPEPDP